jgi:hypothetical protein
MGMSTTDTAVPAPPGSGAPPPPPGPGVQPPFVAPPTDGTRQRRWTAVGIAAGGVVLVLVLGLLGFGALVVLGNKMVIDESRAAVTRYLSQLRDRQYEQAYDELCQRVRDQTSRQTYVARASAGAQISGFDVGQPSTGSANEVVVPTRITLTNETVTNPQFLVATNGTAFQVCGQRG